MSMTCSIVIATYNRGASLLALLRDLEAQVYDGPFEVVVVDDGSRTPVRPLLEQSSWCFPLTLVEQANGGQAAARHVGVTKASGEVVIIVDDDMGLPAHFVAAHMACHVRGFDVVLGLIRPADALLSMPLFERFHAAQLEGFVADMRAGKPIHGAALCTGNVSFRKRDYERAGGFDLTLKRSEDRDLGIRLQRLGARFTFSEHAYTTHRSDHVDLEIWLNRAFLYGVYDTKIGRKYPDDAQSDPWHYVLLIHPLTRTLVASTVVAPAVSRRLSRLAFTVADGVASRGLERLAIRGATVAFALEYFRGVRSEYHSASAAARGFVRFLRTQHPARA